MGEPIFDEWVEECGWVLDFDDPGVLPIRVRYAGEKDRASVPRDQELGLIMPRAQELEHCPQPRPAAHELGEQAEQGGERASARRPSTSPASAEHAQSWPEQQPGPYHRLVRLPDEPTDHL